MNNTNHNDSKSSPTNHQPRHLKNVIFDLGGVLIDWNPRHLYKKVLQSEQEIENFLATVCTDEWNLQQDAGRSLTEGTELLCRQHPEKEHLIRLYYARWHDMLGGAIPETVTALYALKERGVQLYSLTNWSHETFSYARKKFTFLNEFLDIVVSGEEKLLKPDPRIYQLLLQRNNLHAAESVFVDDRLVNVHAAESLGMTGIHFTSPQEFALELEALGLLTLHNIASEKI